MSRASRLLERFERALERDDRAEAERTLLRLRSSDPGTRERAQAELLWLEMAGDEDALLDRLRGHVERWADDADALHRLGGLLLARGREAEAVEHWQRVRSLDAAQDEAAGVGGADDEAFVVEAAETALERVPERLRSHLRGVTILAEDRPSAELVATGFDPRAYGLFEGPTQAQASAIDAPPQPSRIVLYVHNLVADAETDDDLEEEVAITVLHEIGHFFGLDEEDLVRLGLE